VTLQSYKLATISDHTCVLTSPIYATHHDTRKTTDVIASKPSDQSSEVVALCQSNFDKTGNAQHATALIGPTKNSVLPQLQVHAPSSSCRHFNPKTDFFERFPTKNGIPTPFVLVPSPYPSLNQQRSNTHNQRRNTARLDIPSTTRDLAARRGSGSRGRSVGMSW
jgi:hypothetical protein